MTVILTFFSPAQVVAVDDPDRHFVDVVAVRVPRALVVRQRTSALKWRLRPIPSPGVLYSKRSPSGPPIGSGHMARSTKSSSVRLVAVVVVGHCQPCLRRCRVLQRSLLSRCTRDPTKTCRRHCPTSQTDELGRALGYPRGLIHVVRSDLHHDVVAVLVAFQLTVEGSVLPLRLPHTGVFSRGVEVRTARIAAGRYRPSVSSADSFRFTLI